MSRGFASFLFFFLAAPLLLLALAWPSLPHSNDNVPSLLSFRRLELETNVDAIIRDELYAGARTTLPASTIQLRINQAILNYLVLFPSAHPDSVEYSAGFSSLSQTNYLSLLSTPLRPLTLLELQSASHVLILPLSKTQRYAEYSYTGGAFGTSILHMRLRARDSNTLFALPAGYHSCVTSFQKSGRVRSAGSMSTFEFILIFSALLSVLALIVPLLQEHTLELENAQTFLHREWSVLRCSSRADFSSAHYILSPSSSCLDYSFSINPPSPFLLVLGGDANHYG